MERSNSKATVKEWQRKYFSLLFHVIHSPLLLDNVATTGMLLEDLQLLTYLIDPVMSNFYHIPPVLSHWAGHYNYLRVLGVDDFSLHLAIAGVVSATPVLLFLLTSYQEEGSERFKYLVALSKVALIAVPNMLLYYSLTAACQSEMFLRLLLLAQIRLAIQVLSVVCKRLEELGYSACRLFY